VTTSVTTATGGQPRPAARQRRMARLDRLSFRAVFLGLPLAIYLIFVIYPFGQALYYSMTDWSGFTPTYNFVGLDNFTKLFHDDTFMLSLRTKGSIRGISGSGFYRVVSFFPYTVPAIVIGLIWAQVYDPSAGILNAFLTKVGFSGFENFAWLGDPRTAMPASMFVIIWSFVGFYTVLFVAAVKGIPAEIYEAARMDGAGRFRTAISITLPLVRDTVQTAYIYLGILALDAFVYMQALNPNGGPNNTTRTMSQELFNTAFRQGQFGYATAMGVVLAVVTLLFAVIVFAINRLTGAGERRRRR
jgi:N-acetylglucosamine transport system permease protein